jgi:hypothetical protein
MFAVVNHLHLSIPVEQVRLPLQMEALPLLQVQSGFLGAHVVKEAEDRAIVILLWASATDAQNGAQVFGPGWFHQNIAPYLASEQQRSVGEVIASSEMYESQIRTEVVTAGGGW